MGKLLKIILGLTLASAVILIGLSLFARFYLTEERVKTIIIPSVETTLARQVSIGSINVNLLHGITINDFIIKESDGKTDFIRADSFVLRYNLAALLKKQVQISEVRIEKPVIHIHRNKQRKFNFESLAILQPTPKTVVPTTTTTTAATLPLALLVDQIVIQQAEFIISDNMGTLPQINTSADLTLAVNLKPDISSLTYQGELQFVSEIIYGDIKPRITGTFSRPQVTLDQSTVKKQMGKTIQKKVIKEIDRALGDKQGEQEEAVKQLFRGLFGQ